MSPRLQTQIIECLNRCQYLLTRMSQGVDSPYGFAITLDSADSVAQEARHLLKLAGFQASEQDEELDMENPATTET